MTFFDDINRTIELGKLGISAKRSQGADPNQDALKVLIEKMASLRGLPQKIGQILSLNELNSESSHFLKLTEGSAQLSSQEINEIIERELGANWNTYFSEITPDGVSASLGQVHRAKTVNGNNVAIKVQYPKIERALQYDIKALGLLSLPLTGKQRGFHFEEYRKTLSESLFQELDYLQELAALERFQQYHKSEPSLVSPIPFPELSTQKVLTMSWIEGLPIESTRTWDFSERLFIARTLTRFFFKEWLIWREVHADPHSGNYRFERSNDGIKIGLLDFGCTKRLSQDESSALQAFLVWGESPSQNLLELYGRLGFDQALLEPIEKKLPLITEILLEPFLSKRPFLISEWQISKRIDKILGDDRWNFRIAGPASLIFFIRALSGLIQQLQFLSVPVNWNAELQQVCAQAPRKEVLLPSTKNTSCIPQQTTPAANTHSSQASHLKIAVLENDLPKVQLSFKPHLVTQLNLLMDKDLLEKIEARGIKLEELAQSVMKSGYRKQELFSLSEESKNIKVWLE